jgi:hypothetical protein
LLNKPGTQKTTSFKDCIKSCWKDNKNVEKQKVSNKITKQLKCKCHKWFSIKSGQSQQWIWGGLV